MAQPNQFTAKPVRERFFSYVTKSPGCWIWRGAKSAHGYGSFRANGKMFRVHRFAYELGSGPIPAGMTVHHTCFNRLCVKPGHLKLMPHGENARFENKSRHCPSCTCHAKKAA